MSRNFLSIASELRRTVRSLLRYPTFTAAAVLTLALGIGATTAIFSVVYGVLIKPLPYPDAHELVSIRHAAPGSPAAVQGFSESQYVTYREATRAFEHVGFWSGTGRTLTGSGDPEHVRVLTVTDGTLQALGVQPAMGRLFVDAEHSPGAGAPASVIVSYAFWQRRFGGDGSVLGRTLALDGRSYEIVGVMPAGFNFLDLKPQPDVIDAMRIDATQMLQCAECAPSPLGLGFLNYTGMARLRDGVTLAEATSDVARMLPIWLDAWPARPGQREAIANWRLAPVVTPLKDDVIGGVAEMLWLLMATVGAVLLIACANIANLLLVRADARRHELTIRAVLGAGRRRIAGELLRESLVLGALGGVIGLALAYAGLELLSAFAPANLPRVEDITVGAPVLAFAAAAALVSSLAFGAIPAVKHAFGSDARLGAGARGATASREGNRTRGALIVVQVALALVLLVGAGLMIRTFQGLTALEPGFSDPEHVQVASVFFPPWAIPEHERAWHMQREILERIAALPGVAAVGIGGAGLSDRGLSGSPGAAIEVEVRPDLPDAAPARRNFAMISPGYFQALGTRLVAGRDVAWTDVDDDRPIVWVSENFARAVWGEPQAALGKRIRWDGRGDGTGAWREIVGVTQDVYASLFERPPTNVYVPTTISDLRRSGYVIRTDRAGTENFVNEVRQAVSASHPVLAVLQIPTLQDIYSDALAPTSFMLVLLAIAGAMALTLSVVGIYGVISYIVSQRRREIGIRLALGAQARSVQRMFLRQGLVVAMIGVAVGLAAAVGLSRWLTSFLFEVRPLDLPTYVTVLGVLLVAVALAAYVPARRAAELDPVETLRAE
jgi:putative ABC transport system permease protein